MTNNAKSNLKNNTISGMFWTFSERISAQVVSFIVSIILARLLLPEEYGVIAIVTVIISICNVFVTSGFATSLIQKKDADEIDFSSVFYFSFIFAGLLYIGMYFAAPLIAGFYGYEILIPVIRVMSLSVLISSVKSVQHSYLTRAMQFKKFFWSTLGGTMVSAVVGIVLAYLGYGVWALVAQYLTNNLIGTLVLWFTVRWRPKLKFSFVRLKGLLAFGWKVLASNLLMTIYQEIRTIIIGVVYTSEDLAYYQKGQQFPNLIVTNVNTAISSTLLPVMSKIQSDNEAIKNVIRRFLKTATFLLFPAMLGLLAVSEPLVCLLLTEKWLPCVPYMRLLAVSAAFLPLQVANTQAVLAVGRSDISLKTEILKRGFNIVVLLLTFKISVFALVIGEFMSTFFSLIVNTVVSKKLFNYGMFAQLKDIAPYIFLSVVMCVATMPITLLGLSDILTISIQVIVGIVVYVGLSIVFKLDSFYYVLNTIKSLINRFVKKKS